MTFPYPTSSSALTEPQLRLQALFLRLRRPLRLELGRQAPLLVAQQPLEPSRLLHRL